MGFLDRFRTPREPGDAADGDRLILAQLTKLGADLRLPRHVLHYSYFPSEDAARRAAESLSASGYSCEVREPLPGYSDWSVVAETTAVVNETTVAPTRQYLEGVASVHGGEYDGWEAAGEP